MVSEEDARAAEAARIRQAYAERDVEGIPAYTYANPGFHFHMQDLEWEVTSALRASGFALAGASVLEVGCGSGHKLRRLIDLGAAAGTGVDLSESRIREGRVRHPELTLEVADAAGLPFADASFDLATQFLCLSSVLDARVRAGIASEMLRVTRPGGAVLSYDLRPTPGLVRAAGRAVHALRGDAVGDSVTATVPIGAAELRALFSPAVTIRTVSLNLELASVAGRSTAAARLLKAVPALRTHHLALVRRP